VDIKAYIESGILEQFVMGNTNALETEEVLRLASLHPEIQSEIDAIEEALFAYSASNSVQPPDKIKERLFSELAFNELIEKETTIVNENHTRQETVVKPIRSFNYFLVAASVVLLCVSIAGNVWLYNRWQDTENQLVSVNSEKFLLTSDLKVREASYAEMESKMKFMMDPGMKKVVLKGLPLMPQALANVYHNPKYKEVYFSAEVLPAISDAERYQLWAIVNGTPVDAGLIYSSDALGGFVKMKSVEGASAFAVTIEPKGGSITPTMDKMVLMGAAS